MNFLARHRRKFIASLGITVAVWWVLHRGGLKLVPNGPDFRAVRWWTVVVYLASLPVTTWFRSARWRYLLRGAADVPTWRVVTSSCVGFAAVLLLPFRLGEFVRPYMIRHATARDAAPIGMAAATTSVVAERVVDGLLASVILAAALLGVRTIEPLPETVVGLPVAVATVRQAGFVMLALFAAAFAGIALFYFAQTRAHDLSMQIIGKLSPKLARRMCALLERFAGGLHAFRRAREAGGFLVETALYWLLSALGMWFLAWGCGVVHADGSALGFGETCALMGLLSCSIFIPGPPGLLGTFQAGLYAGMTMYVPTDIVTGPGATYVFLLYASQVVFQLMAGALALLVEHVPLQLLTKEDLAVTS